MGGSGSEPWADTAGANGRKLDKTRARIGFIISPVGLNICAWRINAMVNRSVFRKKFMPVNRFERVCGR
ncbi:MAG: hypothetical protein ACJARR_003134 [Pseudophaeobacter arcticus]|jgi:hypothetical protein